MQTPIFYDPRQSVSGVDSYSPSAGKPARFVELMAHYQHHAYSPEKLGRVTAVSKDDLKLVHGAAYVDGVFAGTTLNGFENNDPCIAESCLWTVGSLLAAARHALLVDTVAPVCSPTSGFHHAGFNDGGGFCTFNGLMVVAAILIQENPGMKVAVLDCDQHFGNGTVDILKHRPVLSEYVMHKTAGAKFFGDDPEHDAKDFTVWLNSCIAQINSFKPDLVLYQAGADQHVDDPLGGFLTTEQMAARDRAVFRGIKAPVVWNLAGGYQEPTDGTIFTDPVLQIHRNTLIESDLSIPFRS